MIEAHVGRLLVFLYDIDNYGELFVVRDKDIYMIAFCSDTERKEKLPNHCLGNNVSAHEK